MNQQALAIVLIVDQTPDHLTQIGALLQDQYDIRLAATGAAALAFLAQVPRPDLVLLDVALPEPDGYSICRQMKSSPDTAGIPVMLTASTYLPLHEQRGYDAGAADVLAKPLVAETLRARVATQLRLKRAEDLLAHQSRLVTHLVSEHNVELSRTLDAVIWAMASLAEARDDATLHHFRRVQHYVVALARALQPHKRFAAQLGDADIALLYKAAPLHDIGKAGLPDAILQQPGRLSDAEFEQMKRHTEYGRDTIAAIEQHLGRDNTLLRYAREIAHSHQEKFDGSGYPQGLAGDAIPLPARLMAVADVYDALISRRSYRPAFTHETAVELIRQASGEHFDPDVVDAMLEVEEQFMDIAQRYSDAH